MSRDFVYPKLRTQTFLTRKGFYLQQPQRRRGEDQNALWSWPLITINRNSPHSNWKKNLMPLIQHYTNHESGLLWTDFIYISIKGWNAGTTTFQKLYLFCFFMCMQIYSIKPKSNIIRKRALVGLFSLSWKGPIVQANVRLVTLEISKSKDVKVHQLLYDFYT